MPPRNVLIFHAGALGDFILSWPLGLALGRLYPQSRVIFVTQRQKGDLAERVLRLEAMDVELGWHHLFGDAANLPDVCRRRLAGAHGIFTFVAKRGDTWIDAVAAIATQATIVPVDIQPPEDQTVHASQRLLHSLAEHPAAQAAVGQMLASIAAQGIGAVPGGSSGPIVVHPGSGSREKCWPLESYLRLVERFHAAGRRCKILLGEVELERWPGDTIRRVEGAAETSRPQTYAELLEHLRAAATFVGNDSGPGHLAGIIGTPTLVLFGPTDPAVWRPLGPRVRTLRGRPLASLAADDVYSAIVGMLG
jgi:ADP-heptose:LPS heptosyltransferase